MNGIKDVLAGIFIVGGFGLMVLIGIVGIVKVIRESKGIKDNE